jgi:hypothetical protein
MAQKAARVCGLTDHDIVVPLSLKSYRTAFDALMKE